VASPKLSTLELRIMSEFWTRGACSIREIHEIGNAHVFEATTSRASVQTRLLKEVLGLFGGNVRPVMAHLVEMGKISREDIDDALEVLRVHNTKDKPK
jgi:BlaI family transcriptional regulator, penicillinase repressor